MGFKQIKIGGELPLKELDYNHYFTDSGRSSIRLFALSYPNKKILLPNFLCEVVVRVLSDLKIKYDFYNINLDLTIDENSIKNKEFDVLYIINYFGMTHNYFDFSKYQDKMIIEDNVFKVRQENINNIGNLFSFNSYRKVSELADGSEIITNIDINDSLISSKPEFSKLKYEAKAVKYNLLTNNSTDEKYLDLFTNAEKVLDVQKRIYCISGNSQHLLLNYFYKFEGNHKTKKDNFELLKKNIAYKDLQLINDPVEYSFFVIKTDKRDLLRKFLFTKNIFLPVHWPSFGIDHELYDTLISIPLFPFYSKKSILHIAKSINEFYVKVNLC